MKILLLGGLLGAVSLSVQADDYVKMDLSSCSYVVKDSFCLGGSVPNEMYLGERKKGEQNTLKLTTSEFPSNGEFGYEYNGKLMGLILSLKPATKERYESVRDQLIKIHGLGHERLIAVGKTYKIDKPKYSVFLSGDLRRLSIKYTDKSVQKQYENRPVSGL